MKRVALLTGYPSSLLARQVARRVLETEPETEVRAVVPERLVPRAEEARAELGAVADRLVLLDGDAAAMDLGLSGRELRELADEVNVIHHCAAVTYLGSDRESAVEGNVVATREVLELAALSTELDRLVLWSTALVSGTRRGVVREDDLDTGSFRNVVEQTRYRAERLVRKAADKVPVTILRPATIVGDSRTGAIDRFEGPYLLVLLMLSSPIDLRVPLPGRGDVPLNLVPIDYAVEAGLAIARDPRSRGRTFHIVDAAPLTTRQVFELIAQAAGRPLPRAFLPTGIATTLLRTPGIERFGHVPRGFLEQLATDVSYDDRNAREILGELGMKCPAFPSYVDALVQYVRDRQAFQQESQGAERSVEEDPLG